MGVSGLPLCGFMRRLFLQVLLEDEKVLICFRSASQIYKGQSNALSGVVQHPRCGAGHKYRVMYVSLQSTCGDALKKVSGWWETQIPKMYFYKLWDSSVFGTTPIIRPLQN